MKIKIFGKSLFEMKTKKSEIYFAQAMGVKKESKYLPDFEKFNASAAGWNNPISNYVIMESPTTGGAMAIPWQILGAWDEEMLLLENL